MILRAFLMLLTVLFPLAAAEKRELDKTEKPAPQVTVSVADFQNRHPLLDQDWLSSATADLIGIPWQGLVGPKGLAEGKVELKKRVDGSRELLTQADVLERLAS